MHPQVARWKAQGFYQNFLRQIHTDIYVGLKNGEKPARAKQALHELCQEIEASVDWIPVRPLKKRA